MTIRELTDALAQFDPERDAHVVLLKEDGTREEFDIEEITENNGHAQLEIHEDDIFFEEDF